MVTSGRQTRRPLDVCIYLDPVRVSVSTGAQMHLKRPGGVCTKQLIMASTSKERFGDGTVAESFSCVSSVCKFIVRLPWR